MVDEVKKLKVIELKEMLSERGLSTSGKKDELVTRLEEAMAEDGANSTTTPAPAPTSAHEAAPAAASVPVSDPQPAAASAPAAPADDAPAAAEGAPALSDFEAKKAMRASRFGIPVVSKPEPTINPKKKGGAALPDDAEKIKKREERFGKTRPAAEVDPAEADKNKKRAERFGNAAPQSIDPEEEERRKKRAERFAKTA